MEWGRNGNPDTDRPKSWQSTMAINTVHQLDRREPGEPEALLRRTATVWLDGLGERTPSRAP